MIIAYSSLFATLFLVSGIASAQLPGAEASHKPAAQEQVKKPDAEWVSYRNIYKLMIRFEKYGKPKNLIQNHFQILTRQGNYAPDDLELTLVSKSMRLGLPLDAAGRANFPLLKSAYDENAELVVNHAPEQLMFQSRISIIPRADGVYEIAELRAACEQAWSYLKNEDDATVAGKKCTGIKFAYGRNITQAQIRFRNGTQQTIALPVQDGNPFLNELPKINKIAHIRFTDVADKGQVLTQHAPVIITPMFE
ncbi:hypothetical protein ACO0K9_14375 [Undibacterium sp. Ji50W]|uniref:hypothetical protein n=1 Tax=Undibacterium sp. Ji50W TaxID=3413041 RepID=UPI003BF01899